MAVAYAGKGLLSIYMGNAMSEMTLQQNKVSRIISDINAESAELEAFKALQHGYSQTARYQAVIDKTVGAQAVAQAQGDFSISEGTAADVREETRLTGYLNTLDIMQQARGKSKQLKMQAANIRLQSDMGSIQAGIDAAGQRYGGMLKAFGGGIDAFSNVGEFNMDSLSSTGYSGT